MLHNKQSTALSLLSYYFIEAVKCAEKPGKSTISEVSIRGVRIIFFLRRIREVEYGKFSEHTVIHR